MIPIKIKLDSEFYKREVGKIIINEGVPIFITHRNPKHWYNRLAGFGMNYCLIDELLRKKVNLIKIIYHGINKITTYLVNTKTVKDKGIVIHHYPFEKQLIIQKKYLIEL